MWMIINNVTLKMMEEDYYRFKWRHYLWERWPCSLLLPRDPRPRRSNDRTASRRIREVLQMQPRWSSPTHSSTSGSWALAPCPSLAVNQTIQISTSFIISSSSIEFICNGIITSSQWNGLRWRGLLWSLLRGFHWWSEWQWHDPTAEVYWADYQSQLG